MFKRSAGNLATGSKRARTTAPPIFATRYLTRKSVMSMKISECTAILNEHMESACAFFNMGLRLGRTGVVTLDDNDMVVSGKDCFEMAISRDGSYDQPYIELALYLGANPVDEAERLRLMSTAISMDTKDARAYITLGVVILKSPYKGIGQVADAEKYFRKALELQLIDRLRSIIYCGLAQACKERMIKLREGEEYSRKELYIRAIFYDPHNADAYYGAADEMLWNEKVRLADGTLMSKLQCALRAIEYDPSKAEAYEMVANIKRFYADGPVDETVLIE